MAVVTNFASDSLAKPSLLLSLVAFTLLGNDGNDVIGRDSTKSQCQDSKNHPTADLTSFAPTLPIYVFRPNPHLEIAFDARTRNPVYVLERLPVAPLDNDASQPPQVDDDDVDHGDFDDEDQPKSSSPPRTTRRRRRPNFYEEVSLPEMFRSRNCHYRYSGYDRGHLAPAADFMVNYGFLQDTFNLCNISPQDPALNRMLWAQLELWVRQVAHREWEQHQNTTLVLTGPLWLPSVYHPPSSSGNGVAQFEYRYPAVGQPPSLLSVPTHFFKVVVVVADAKDGVKIDKFACFVVPNQKLVEQRRLEDYLVRWSDLEAVVGMRFFPQLAQPSIIDLADALTDGVGELVLKSKGTSHNRRLLLLSDGSSSLIAKRPNKINVKHRSTLEHLCSRGSCR